MVRSAASGVTADPRCRGPDLRAIRRPRAGAGCLTRYAEVVVGIVEQILGVVRFEDLGDLRVVVGVDWRFAGATGQQHGRHHGDSEQRRGDLEGPYVVGEHQAGQALNVALALTASG
jgi:hypothetical protein